MEWLSVPDYIQIEGITLQRATALLTITVRSSRALGWQEYADIVADIDRQAKESLYTLGNLHHEVLLINADLEEDELPSFCHAYLTDKLPDEENTVVSVSAKTVVVSVGKKQSLIEQALIGLSKVIERSVDVCSVEATKETVVQKDIGKFKEVKEKTSSASKKKSDGNELFPGVESRVLLGNGFSARTIHPINDISMDNGRVNVVGRPIAVEMNPTKDPDRFRMCVMLSDEDNTIRVQWFSNARTANRIVARIKGGRLGVKGSVMFDDRFSKETYIMATDITWYNVQERQDDSKEKHIELHAHTKMSMDGLADAKDLVMEAARFGQPSVAITDHGVVQSFPMAWGAANDAKKKYGKPIKVIYGVEAYMADDTVYYGEDKPLNDLVVFDVETTGVHAETDHIIEIGAVRLVNGEVGEAFSTFVNPGCVVPREIVELTGITDEMVEQAPDTQTALRDFAAFVGDRPLVAHNAHFDVSFIRNEGIPFGFAFENGVLDTLTLARLLLPNQNRHSLAALCKYYGVDPGNHHRACDDAIATAGILLRLLESTDRAKTCAALNGIGSIRALPTYHTILLVKNQQGMNALYRLITASHLEHYHRRPNMPKSLVQSLRENLLIGSACVEGELLQAILRQNNGKHLSELAAFYDYLEIQQPENNAFLLRDERDAKHITTMEQIAALNDRVYALGKKLEKPVVATCDVHFLAPTDARLRRILLTGQGFDDADCQPPLYLHTTNEMMQAFSQYMGESAAHEVVVENPMQIDRQIEGGLLPYPEGETYQPHEENADKLLRQITLDGAKKIYGDPLPEIVSARLERELGCVIGNGFEVLYLSAYRLVSNSMREGYSVGSRGSVGSSMIAFCMGISEVNPMPPHYLCPHCHYSEFLPGSNAVGIDLPPKECPSCGEKMDQDGFEIPFEVFLGFNGDKVPDIDLNFSGEYQERAFALVNKMFGADNVFRAGTIVGVAEKTAYGYVRKYMEEHNARYSRAHIDMLTAGITGVKRTTGQHPAGLVILPQGMDIFDFTPLQRPADKSEATTVTTHFDFNSLHDKLVKLDILGHDNPTMIKRLHEFTGIDPLSVPLNDSDTLSLFQTPDALGLTKETLGVSTGTLGLPEFGTGFVIGMLQETKPSTVAELIRISGLSHGTDVWLGNAQEIIRSGTAPLIECICTRDDIMNTLINKGVEPLMSFKIMESVRKGRGITDEQEQEMKKKGVASWFIDSCKKIKYMFPKAHAAAYVTSALRIGYYKVHYPLAYYAAYFSVRAEELDAIHVLHGIRGVERKIQETNRKESVSARDEKELNHLGIAREMMLRGYDFLPPDLFTSDVKRYLIEGNSLRMPLMSIAGLGENAANSVVEARKNNLVKTVDDLRTMTKLSGTLIEKLRDAGSLAGVPESAQISFFEMI